LTIWSLLVVVVVVTTGLVVVQAGLEPALACQ